MDAHEKFDLKKLMAIEVPQERVDRLRDSVVFDRGDISDEIKDFLLREQIRFVNIQYARFLAGVHFTQDDVDELLTGSIDIHAHGGSEPFDRIGLETSMLKSFMQAKMRATVIKTWYTPSASRNALLTEQMQRMCEEDPTLSPVKLFGGITLNQSVGGLNPNAVERCLKYPGMKYVWLPMVDSYFHRKLVYDDQTGSGIHVLDENGKVPAELKEIFRICADNNLILASGHYPYKETSVVFEEAIKMGVKNLEVVHPAHIHSKTTIEQMKQYAKENVKLMLSGLGTLCFPLHETGPVYAAQMISEVGADHFVYGSDFGQIHNPPHIIGNRWMIQILLAYGVTKEEITKIFKTNPAKHLGLEN